MLLSALPVGVAGLCVIAYARSDILMLEWMSDSISAGMYSAGYRLTGSLGTIPIALTTTLLPLVSEAHSSGGRERIEKMYRVALPLVTIAALPLVLGVFIFSQEIVFLVYGAEYLAA